MIELRDYLGEVRRRRFGYGELDCCIFMADWLVRRGFSDPMADRRGMYSTYAEYRRLVRAEGGLMRSCRRRFAAIGLRETSVVKPGDPCLVMAPMVCRGRTIIGALGTIVVSDRFSATVTSDAVVVGVFPRLRTWSV